MPTLDELKKQIKEEASSNPEKFFATDVLKEKDFNRGECENCGIFFWSKNPDRKVCGEPDCSGGYSFIGDSPTEESFSYTGIWKLFEDFMQEREYSSIDRYPVVARWRDDVEFVGASIYDFQPHVVSGEAEPPSTELIVPQPSLRFNDVDNVGITGRHYTSFVMVGQACFQPPEKYDRDRYFRDMFDFATKGLGIPEKELILHEESWGGGGNLGPCMEFFVDGLELWNQVYMLYEQTPEGYEELDLQVLDMGMGLNRITWLSNGTETSYECVMHDTVEKMEERTGVERDKEVWQDFLPYSGFLNIDEVDNIDEEWKEIANKIDMEVYELKKEIKPAAALYSIADHARTLLFALADGKIPSNTGGGHNLRLVYRRAKDLIELYDWNLDIGEIAEWHAQELKPVFPELIDSIDEVQKVLEVEDQKYQKARERARQKLEQIDQEPSVEQMIELYGSHGVSPEMMEEHGFEVPEDFYARVASEDEVKQEVEEKFDLEGVPETELLYYEDEKRKEMTAEVVAVWDEWIALDETFFYPQSGGQEADHGRINGEKVVDVEKQGDVVLHRVPTHNLEKGDEVEGRIEWERRLQLMQHHSTTHMVNGAARELLGEHIWQAGAHKTVEKGRLDITHYEKLSREELDQIEERVNQIIDQGLRITKKVMQKTEAEQEYGFRLYQGGAPPGNEVRVVEIEGVDTEACGGTHLSSTGEAEKFIVTGSKKVQDGVIRLNYKAGKAAEQHLSGIRNRVEEIAEIMDIEMPDEKMLGGSHREVQRKLCDIFSVEPSQLVDTVERFREENSEIKRQADRLGSYLESDFDLKVVETGKLVKRCRSLYEAWKHNEKQLESLDAELEPHLEEKLQERVLEEEIPTENISLLIQVARKLANKKQASITLIGDKGAVSASEHEDYDADQNLEKYSDNVQGDESFAKAFDIN